MIICSCLESGHYQISDEPVPALGRGTRYRLCIALPKREKNALSYLGESVCYDV
jgi:hypothetical protein